MFTWFINEASADKNSVHICIFNTPAFDTQSDHEGDDNNICAQKLNRGPFFI